MLRPLHWSFCHSFQQFPSFLSCYKQSRSQLQWRPFTTEATSNHQPTESSPTPSAGNPMDTPNWGDHVLLRCIHRRKQYLIRLKNGATLNTQLGAVSHDEIKKRTYGDIVEFGNSQKGSWKNKVVILRPTFQDIVIKISRSCTPVYPKDMAQIAMLLNLKEGDRVLEAGTGSGLFAMFLSRCVGKTGEVWSYETREDFYKDAQLRANVLHPNHNIKFFLGNVTTCNPPVPFDAIVLDLADPCDFDTCFTSSTRCLLSLYSSKHDSNNSSPSHSETTKSSSAFREHGRSQR